jgi:hypothetical protein
VGESAMESPSDSDTLVGETGSNVVVSPTLAPSDSLTFRSEAPAAGRTTTVPAHHCSEVMVNVPGFCVALATSSVAIAPCALEPPLLFAHVLS